MSKVLTLWQGMTGTVLPFAGTTAPNGWLLCSGQLVSRTTYSTLFGIIGTTYGAGDGSTTFNLPDLRGEFIRGLDSGRGLDAGRALGSQQEATTVRGGGIDSTADSTWVRPTPAINNPDATTAVTGDRLLIDKAETTTESVSMTEFSVRPRNVALHYIIKA